MTNLTQVEMTEIPSCDFPHETPTMAEYDGKTIGGPWAYMCQYHFTYNGTGLGTGKGQRLVLKGS